MLTVKKKNLENSENWNYPGGPVLLLQGAQLQSLVRELKTRVPHRQKRKFRKLYRRKLKSPIIPVFQITVVLIYLSTLKPIYRKIKLASLVPAFAYNRHCLLPFNFPNNTISTDAEFPMIVTILTECREPRTQGHPLGISLPQPWDVGAIVMTFTILQMR